jgi:hypothetical protein
MESFDQEMEQTYYDLNNLIGEWQEEDVGRVGSVKDESPEYEPFHGVSSQCGTDEWPDEAHAAAGDEQAECGAGDDSEHAATAATEHAASDREQAATTSMRQPQACVKGKSKFQKSCGGGKSVRKGKGKQSCSKSSNKCGEKSSNKCGEKTVVKGKSVQKGKGKKGKARQFWVKGSGRRMLGGTPLSSSKGCRLSRTQKRLESGVHLNWLEREGASFVLDK